VYSGFINGYRHLSAYPFEGAHYGLSPVALGAYDFWAEAESTPAGSFYSPPIPALGGVRVVLTEAAIEAVAPDVRSWDFSVIPTGVVDRKIAWNADNADSLITTHRSSEYERHFPQRNQAQVNVETFSDTMRSILFFWQGLSDGLGFLRANYEDRSWASKPVTRAPSARFADLAGLMAEQIDEGALTMGQKTVSFIRFMSTRGNRMIPGWEGGDRLRGLALRNFARTTRQHQDYRAIAYRLWSRYLFGRTVEDVQAWNARRRGSYVNLTPHVEQIGAHSAIRFIHAGPVIGQNAVSPEAEMWLPGAQSNLREGFAQFIDAEGFTEHELVELLSAIDPMTDANRLTLRRGARGERHDGDETRHYVFGPTRHIHAPRTTQIFVHMGNNPNRFSRAAQGRIRGAVHMAPNPNDIASVLNILATRHGAGDDILFGLEAAMWRYRSFKSEFFKGLRNNAPRNRFVYADSNVELHLPRPNTASAYFDTFYTPEPVPALLDETLQTNTPTIVNHGVLLAHWRSVSLSWAAFAFCMLGRQWTNRPMQENNRIIRNHIDAITRTYNYDKITQWSSAFANAMGLQYGFAPTQDTRSTEAGFVINFWRDFQAPVMSNHYHELHGMRFMPTFQVLPYFDNDAYSSHVSWPEGKANPIPAEEAFTGEVLLAGDRVRFPWWAWLLGGGPSRNAQFYAAQGTQNGWRYEGNHTQDFSILRAQVQTAYGFAQAPAAQAPIWMDGVQTPFADFLLPGQLPEFNMAQNISYEYGVRLNRDNTTPTISHRWFLNAKQEPHQSLMVNYIHPTRDNRAIDSLLDYSTVFWESGNVYSGMTLEKHEKPTYEVDSSFDPSARLLKGTHFQWPAGRPDPQRNIEHSRIAKRGDTKRPTPGADVARVSTPIRQPKVTFSPKNPEFLEDLPPMDEHTVTVDSNGMHLDGDTATKTEIPLMSGAASGYDYDLEVERAKQLDDAFQDFLASQLAEQASYKRARWERDQARLAATQSYPRRTPTVRKQAYTPSPTKAPATAANLGEAATFPAQGRFPVRPSDNVVPNDSAAGTAQADAKALPTPRPPVPPPPTNSGNVTPYFPSTASFRTPVPQGIRKSALKKSVSEPKNVSFFDSATDRPARALGSGLGYSAKTRITPPRVSAAPSTTNPQIEAQRSERIEQGLPGEPALPPPITDAPPLTEEMGLDPLPSSNSHSDNTDDPPPSAQSEN